MKRKDQVTDFYELAPTSGHTRGEWEAGTWATDDGLIVGVQVGLERSICRISPVKQADREDYANAVLIAAAPKLLEAVKQLVSAFDCGDLVYRNVMSDFYGAFGAARNAIKLVEEK
jgi:hypothetical protein